ncbi:hypothetical protein [Fictibacillus gelatini]|uniref:hypothetical protein n=1 Tax=Fictibacillus gelatini TaxID=225985 RepID=UPI0003FD68AA|nr:hypothetical protein [Fictibacillus gelatini]
MKKLLTLVVLFAGVFLFIFSGCDSKNEKNLKQIVWDQLSAEQKKEVVGSWKNAKVKKMTLHKGMSNVRDHGYFNKKVYLVSFQSNKGPGVGDFGVFVDMKTKKIIGVGYRD